MNNHEDAIMKSFQELAKQCHDSRAEPIRPIEVNVQGAGSEIPIIMPAVDNEELRPLLLAWYYAGYYTGRHQALQEHKVNKNN
ncbi:hypothetical protein SteCoe_10838 [Stentor coeruleus]|uniref:Survival motor neuron Tudor domain-containing protein n=1 Tax=Stentor coeruleus TaxID=5963 RepID=A0A1R2CEI5_9CILI|nr:hypothetical protein SteCoe_10838 [Stentor coeruleus]